MANTSIAISSVGKKVDGTFLPKGTSIPLPPFTGTSITSVGVGTSIGTVGNNYALKLQGVLINNTALGYFILIGSGSGSFVIHTSNSAPGTRAQLSVNSWGSGAEEDHPNPYPNNVKFDIELFVRSSTDWTLTIDGVSHIGTYPITYGVNQIYQCNDAVVQSIDAIHYVNNYVAGTEATVFAGV